MRYEIEVFRGIEEYPNYSVSNKGNIKNIKTGRLLKGYKITCGYLQVSLMRSKKRYSLLVHRLVATAFLSNLSGCQVVNHKDENKLNNCSVNLEWCTQQFNAEYSNARHYTLMSPTGHKLKVFNMNKFCKDNKLQSSHMSCVLNGTRKHHKGYTLC